VAGWSMMWPYIRSLCNWLGQCGVDGALDRLNRIVRGNYIGYAIGCAKHQRQDADSDQYQVPDGHPDGYFIPICGELYDQGHNDAEQ